MTKLNKKNGVLRTLEDGTKQYAYTIRQIKLVRNTKAVAMGKCNTKYSYKANKWVFEWAWHKSIRDKKYYVIRLGKAIQSFENKFVVFKKKMT